MSSVLPRQAGELFGELFSLGPPRDVLAGFWSGVRCAVTGIFVGLAGVVTQPIEGYRTAHWTGFFRGAAIGVGSFFFFSATGFCTGFFQLVRGIFATPAAVNAASRGLRWDGEVLGRTEAGTDKGVFHPCVACRRHLFGAVYHVCVPLPRSQQTLACLAEIGFSRGIGALCGLAFYTVRRALWLAIEHHRSCLQTSSLRLARIVAQDQ